MTNILGPKLKHVNKQSFKDFAFLSLNEASNYNFTLVVDLSALITGQWAMYNKYLSLFP